MQALVDMASRHESSPIALSAIASRQDISQNYLEQLFVKLRKAGLVRSVRGPGGGYLLSRSPMVITIGDIFQAVDESLVITECADEKSQSGHNCAKIHECSTQALWAALCHHFNELLFSITIDDVTKGAVNIAPGISPALLRSEK